MCCVNRERDGFLLQYRSNGGDDGAEKEKPDDRSKTRGGFETVTERMQNLTAWFVSDYIFNPRTNPIDHESTNRDMRPLQDPEKAGNPPLSNR